MTLIIVIVPEAITCCEDLGGGGERVEGGVGGRIVLI